MNPAGNRNFYYALATLVGTIIGVGMFGLPYAFSRAGFFAGLIQLVVLAGVIMIIHLVFGEIILRTKDKHNLPGYINKYLGKRWEVIISLSVLIGIFGSMVAYILVGGTFLEVLAGQFVNTGFIPDNGFFIIFWVVMTILILLGLKTIEVAEFLMASGLLVAIGLIAIFSFPHINLENLKTFDGINIFLPYGIILFSLVGTAAIPEVREILVGQERKMKSVIVLGILIPTIVYALFTFVITGVTGPFTSPEAIIGLANVVGSPIYIIGALFGILAIATSYITFGYYLYETFLFDFKVNRNISHIIIAVVPIALVMLGWKNFIAIISFLGAVMGGLEGIAMVMTYLKAKKMGDRAPEYSLKIPNFVYYFLMFIFALGIIYTVIYRG